MLDALLQFDKHLFHVINHDWGNPFFDSVMPWLRTPASWISMYICIVGFCLHRYKKVGLLIIIGIALSAGVADYTSAHYYKRLINRPRPCQDVSSQSVDLRVDCGTGKSFPSTHATDHFAMAFFMIFLFFRRWRWILLWGVLWAGSISFAQVYVGVHYPLDVFCGALYGILVGWLLSLLFKKLQPAFQ
jgi:undecaprenyl-diphosphatase